MKKKTIPDGLKSIECSGICLGDSFSFDNSSGSASSSTERPAFADRPFFQFGKTVEWLLCWSPVLAMLLLMSGCSQSSQESVENDSRQQSDVIETAIGDQPTLAESHYVNDALCADCHRDIFDSYQQVAMSKSFYNFDPMQTIESFEDNHFFHQPSGNHYEMTVVDGKLQMERYRLRDDGSRMNEHAWTADHVVGSGNHVRTYLYRNDAGELYQMPIVWYSQESKWGMAPGYDRPDHPDFSRPITRQCMFCHNAYPLIGEDDADRADRFGMPHVFPSDLPQGIGCQRCHGPGSEHVRVSGELDSNQESDLKRIRDSIVNSARLSPQLQDDVCNQCHFQPMSQRTSFVRKFGKRDFEFRVGQSLSDFMVYFEPDRNNELADHFEINHHPYRLYQSRCFTETDGGIRCTTCHDPHVKLPRVDQARHYREKCLSCHGSNDCLDLEQGRLPDADCVACHMPERRTTDVVHVTMTDHKISRRSRLHNPTAALAEIDVPIDMPLRHYPLGKNRLTGEQLELYKLFARSLDEDRAVIEPLELQLAAERHVPLETALQLAQLQLQQRKYDKAANTLDAVDVRYHALPIFQLHLSVSQIGLAEYDAAVEQLTRTTSLFPDLPPAWYNRGIAHNRLRQHDLAVECLEQAIVLRPDYIKARNRLGSLYAIGDRLDDAARQFDLATRISINDLEAYRKLSAIRRRQQNWPAAIERIQDALQVSSNNPTLLQELVLLLLDVENPHDRNPQSAQDIAGRLMAIENSADAIILMALALIENQRPDEALKIVAEQWEQEDRKAESGLLIAVIQQMLGSTETARTNFTGAENALSQLPQDRIARTILAYARKQFATNAAENRK